MNVIEAELFARNAHESISHKRKYTNSPYIEHLTNVVDILKQITNDNDILSAAWLHDVIEDVSTKNTNFSSKVILEKFGHKIWSIVIELTDVSKEFGNRNKRKEFDRNRLKNSSIEAKTIKLADLIDNYKNIRIYDPKFAKVFREESLLMLPCLVGGNYNLYTELENMLNK